VRILAPLLLLACGLIASDAEETDAPTDADDSEIVYGDTAGVYAGLCDDGLASLSFTVGAYDAGGLCETCAAPVRLSARLFNQCPQVISVDTPSSCLGGSWTLDDGASSQSFDLPCEGPATSWPFPHGTDELFTVDPGPLPAGSYAVTVRTASDPVLEASVAFDVGP